MSLVDGRPPHVLAIDHGTTGIKAAVVSARGRIVDATFVATPTVQLPGGGAEQGPEGWWDALIDAARQLVARARVPASTIGRVAVSSTFSTTVAVDAEGAPVANALTWLDSRGGPQIRAAMGGRPGIRGYRIDKALRWIRRTGAAPALSGKDDIAHVLFLRDAAPDAYRRAAWFLPSKDYLNLRLTGEVATTPDAIQLFYVTDTRDPTDVRYDDDLVRRLGLDRSTLPPLIRPTDVVGRLRPAVVEAMGLPDTVDVVGGAQDMAAALVGSGAVRDYDAHLYLGTSSWVQCPVAFRRVDPIHQIACFPAAIPDRYQIVNEQDIAGGAVDFLIGNMLRPGWKLLDAEPPEDPYAAMEQVAMTSPPGSGRTLFTPWLNGERTPVDDTTLRGGWHNLATTTTLGDLSRAVLEGVAYNVRWSLEYVDRFVHRRLAPLRVIGGGARSDLWCQILADVLDRELHRVVQPRQANARGAALLGAIGAGWTDLGDVPALVNTDAVFTPDPANRAVYDELYDAFRRIHRGNRGVYRRLNGH